MGVVVLGERLRPLQWVAMGARRPSRCVVLTLDYGRPPWVALVLAFSFGTYGLAKKPAGVGAVESLAFETALHRRRSPLAYLGWLAWPGHADVRQPRRRPRAAARHTGIVTAIPLLCFGAAAIRVSMVTLGLLQYLAPILQFALGVLWSSTRTCPPGRWSASCWSGSRWRSSPSRRSATAAASSALTRRGRLAL